jgi:hypothetical protein
VPAGGCRDTVELAIRKLEQWLYWGDVGLGDRRNGALSSRLDVAELREQVAGSMNRASRRAVDTYTRASETVGDVAGRAADIAGNLTDRAAMLTAKLNRAISSSKPYSPIS